MRVQTSDARGLERARATVLRHGVAERQAHLRTRAAPPSIASPAAASAMLHHGTGMSPAAPLPVRGSCVPAPVPSFGRVAVVAGRVAPIVGVAAAVIDGAGVFVGAGVCVAPGVVVLVTGVFVAAGVLVGVGVDVAVFVAGAACTTTVPDMPSPPAPPCSRQ